MKPKRNSQREEDRFGDRGDLRVKSGRDGADAEDQNEEIEGVQRPAQEAGDERIALEGSEAPEVCEKFYVVLLSARREVAARSRSLAALGMTRALLFAGRLGLPRFRGATATSHQNATVKTLVPGRHRASFSQETRGQDCVGDARYLGHFGYIMDADDVRASQDAGCYGCCCAPDPVAASAAA
jgi:hypothetical protein